MSFNMWSIEKLFKQKEYKVNDMLTKKQTKYSFILTISDTYVLWENSTVENNTDRI